MHFNELHAHLLDYSFAVFVAPLSLWDTKDIEEIHNIHTIFLEQSSFNIRIIHFQSHTNE